MAAESVETIVMLRNNTTLVTAQEAPKMKEIGRPSKASRNDKSHMLASAFFLMLCFWLLATDSCASVIKNKVSRYLFYVIM